MAGRQVLALVIGVRVPVPELCGGCALKKFFAKLIGAGWLHSSDVSRKRRSNVLIHTEPSTTPTVENR